MIVVQGERSGNSAAHHRVGRGLTMTNVNAMTEAELAKYYDRTHETSEFDDGEVVVPRPPSRPAT